MSAANTADRRNEDMQVLTVDKRTVNGRSIALPFSTDAEVVAAWEWLVDNKYLLDFSYRPGSEGINLDRAFVELWLASRASGATTEPLDAPHVRKIVAGLYGADLPCSIRPLIRPLEPQPDTASAGA